jgi:hypothetical protein
MSPATEFLDRNGAVGSRKRQIGPAALAFLLWAVSVALAYDDHDRQLKIELQAGGELGGGFDARLQETLTFGDDMREFYEQEMLAMLGWKANAWLKLGAGFNAVQTRKNTVRYVATSTDGATTYTAANDHFWAHESRPTADVTLSRNPGGWKISDRNRFEWRAKEDQAGYLRYRNRLQAIAPWQWTSWKIAPGVSVEVNYEDNADLPSADRLNRTRWLAGLTMKPLKNLQLVPAVFYERNKKNGDWTDLYTLQLGAGLDF